MTREIEQNGVQPGVETGLPAKPMHGAGRFNERVLHEVLGVGFITAQGMAERSKRVPLVSIKASKAAGSRRCSAASRALSSSMTHLCHERGKGSIGVRPLKR
jgi:hypothetical protein